MIKTKNIIFFSIAFLLLIFIFWSDAFAAINPNGILDSVLERFQTEAKTWVTEIKRHARYLFICLATVSMVWTFGQLLYHRSSFAELFGEMIRFLCFTGLFLWFLEHAPAMSEDIIWGLRTIGGQASGTTALSPSGVVDIGISICSMTWENISITDGADGFGAFICSLIILVLLALIGINMLLQLCSAWLLAYAGIFFLGFGGCRWTSDMAINYLKTVLALGASLMTMILLIGLGESFLTEYYSNLSIIKNNGDMTRIFNELLVMLIVSLTLFMLVDKLPPMVAGIVTGSSIGMSTGVGTFGAGVAVGAGMTGVGLASGALSRGVSAVGSSVRTVGQGARFVYQTLSSPRIGNTPGGFTGANTAESPLPRPTHGTVVDK